MTLEQRLEKIEAMLALLVERQQPREWYSAHEFSLIVGRSEFTCREWCRLGRIRARKKDSGRGAHTAWAISHAELQRYQREGLLPRPVQDLDPPAALPRAAADDTSVCHEQREQE